MADFAFDSHRHLSSNFLLFPDGEVKPAFLLASLSDFADRRLYAHHLKRFGLRRGIEFFTLSASEIPSTTPQGSSGNHGNGRRTVLSLEGVLMLISQTRSDFGDAVFYWVYYTVARAVRGQEMLDENNPTLQVLLDQIARMSDEMSMFKDLIGLEGFHGELTLKDIIGTAIDVAEEEN